MRKLTIFLLLSCVVFLSLNIADLTNASDGSGKMSLESRKISCQTFIDLSKLVISLATGVFVVVPSFMSLIKKESIKSKKKLYFGLIFLCISIIFGLFTISALAGTQRMGEYNIASGLIKWISRAQWGFFLGGLSLCGLFLLSNIFEPQSSETSKCYLPE